MEDHHGQNNCRTQSLSHKVEEGEWSSESARASREGFKAKVTFELSLQEAGGLCGWEGWSGDGVQEEGRGEGRCPSRWCALQTMAGSLDRGGRDRSGAEVWWSRKARLSRWVGDTWTLLCMQICSECNRHRRICGKGVP